MQKDVTGRAGLLEILSWARPHDSEAERAFCREYLDSVADMSRDAFGNRMVAHPLRTFDGPELSSNCIQSSPELLQLSRC